MAGSSAAERITTPPDEGLLRAIREAISEATLRAEADAISELLAALGPLERKLALAKIRATHWVEVARADKRARPFAESMMEQFPLDSAQGRALMSLAEALLRTPDVARADQLIAERLAEVRGGGRNPISQEVAGAGRGGDAASSGGDAAGGGAAASHGAGADRSSDNWLLRTGFTLLGGISRLLPNVGAELAGQFTAASITKPVLAPVVRATLRRAMRMLGEAFIVGETIDSALARGRSNPALALCSFDVLGEGARTEADAQRYFDSYANAIDALGHQPPGTVHARSSISVKLSALEPRYTLLQSGRVARVLIPRMLELARKAAAVGIGMTIDAEEADRLELSLDIIEALARDEKTVGWDGLGLAVQAYGRRAPFVIDWVAQLARVTGRRMTTRLVKGAYWDSEIKRAQERGLSSFPVYTSKSATDASYLVCAQRLFANNDVIYPQFATHNAFTVAAVLEMAPPNAQYEFQRLHGMGELVFEAVRADVPTLRPVRAYAPVGTHEDLLPYLVRRLLENGANTSFVHQFLNPQVPVEQVVRDPVSALNESQPNESNPKIREPQALYGPERRNSDGPDWGDPAELKVLKNELEKRARQLYAGGPLIGGNTAKDSDVPVHSPSNLQEIVGTSRDATAEEISNAMDAAAKAQPSWDALPAAERADCLDRAAYLLEERRVQFLSLLVREAGKTIPDAVAELREAVDFCRYYAARGRELFGSAQKLNGPTGERNLLSLHGRGVFVCISPWNFPLAIFAGQITAALMAGNSVIAKPAPATPLVAHAMTALLHEAGVPGDVLHMTPADGPAFSDVAMKHTALAGVAFTGSTATAATINRALANRDGAILPLIAETGGVNAMIVDATALPEQVVDDAVMSAFTSAGQRCSALRVLYLQEEIADKVIGMLTGAMKCLAIGDPGDLSTDVGPVISQPALARLRNHASRMRQEAQLLYACPLDEKHESGYFFAPHLIELRALDQLRSEEFGPILHVVRYKADQLPQVIAAIRKTGFGLTLGVHSRLESVADHVFRSVPVGNTYVNRNMIGAVVGVQPFGGQGLSGTGPKAGGPHYLLRFANERTLTINTVAVGGNVELLS
ncbi:MAG: bifunctional proline dehydrogenase/L-glutamate gamma-semialdehyde dehydrogenase PutA [Proteobacteria bacterium]|nr:bifunctional proline dehydrogenase/L-glutamate gamma-semialdehyde dehydrogenase PutA [Pseudomonadota bacterium]